MQTKHQESVSPLIVVAGLEFNVQARLFTNKSLTNHAQRLHDEKLAQHGFEPQYEFGRTHYQEQLAVLLKRSPNKVLFERPDAHKPDTRMSGYTRDQAKARIETLVEEALVIAKGMGLVLTVTNEPQTPLAMGHYDSVVDVRDSNPVYRAAMAKAKLAEERISHVQIATPDQVRLGISEGMLDSTEGWPSAEVMNRRYIFGLDPGTESMGVVQVELDEKGISSIESSQTFSKVRDMSPVALGHPPLPPVSPGIKMHPVRIWYEVPMRPQPEHFRFARISDGSYEPYEHPYVRPKIPESEMIRATVTVDIGKAQAELDKQQATELAHRSGNV